MALVISPVHAQNNSSTAAVAIRLNNSRTGSGGVESSPQGVRITNLSLLYLVMNAYDVQDFQVAGISAAVTGVKYDVELNNVSDWRQALQKALADRFKLAFHRESKQESAYELVVSGTAPTAADSGKCQATTESPCGGFNATATSIDGQRVSMDQLSSRLTRSLGRTVINKTDLQGTFDITLHWTINQTFQSPADPTASSSGRGGVNIFAALEQQMKLKLVPTTTNVQMFVIDHAETPILN
jgi:uncharacterized protein (TIGR03435 family)